MRRDTQRFVLRFPKLYEVGLHSYDFSAMHLFVRFVSGVVSSIWLYFGSQAGERAFVASLALIDDAAFGVGVHGSDGRVSDHWVLGVTVYNNVVLSATLVVAFFVRALARLPAVLCVRA